MIFSSLLPSLCIIMVRIAMIFHSLNVWMTVFYLLRYLLLPFSHIYPCLMLRSLLALTDYPLDLLREVASEITTPLTELFNFLLQNGVIPSVWIIGSG